MNCTDQSLDYLKNYHYNVVALPRTDIAPLQLFVKKKEILEPLGHLSDLLEPIVEMATPEIQKDQLTSFVSGQRTGELDTKLGLSILGNILSAMTKGKIGIDAEYKKSKKMIFEFQDVLTDSVKPIDVEKYLNNAGPRPLLTHVLDLLNSDKIYMITSVIKSKKIKVEATDGANTDIKLDASAIEKILSPNVMVAKESDNSSSIIYSGPENLVFGFKAIKLKYNNNEYISFDFVEDGGALAGIRDGDSQSNNYKWLNSSALVAYGS